MAKLTLRIVATTLATILALFVALGWAVSYEGPYLRETGRLARLEGLGIRGLEDVHAIMRRTHSLPVKAHALGIILEFDDESSIPILIHEFGYRGRWWMRWDYEEEQDADGWRSIAAGGVLGFGRRAEDQLRSALSDSDEWVRYWALVTLARLDGFEDWELVRELAYSDKSENMRSRAQDELRRRFPEL